MDLIIVAEHLSKCYRGDILAVNQVSIEVYKGEIFGFLGPNGAGKSTTIHMLTTIIRPTGGKARVCGFDAIREPHLVRRNIGFVSQDIAVDEALTGRENLALQGRFYHLRADVILRRTQELLALVDLTDRADHLVSAYSGGMRKRLDIAAGLIHRPSVLFLDEPTLGLDIQTRHRIWEYVKKLREEQEITIFLTTHYMDEADSLCDRIAIIDHGQIVALGPPGNLKEHIGGDLLSIKLAPGRWDENALQRDMARLPGVEKVSPGPDGSFSLIVQKGEFAAPGILAALVEMGLEIQSISLKRPSLDDVFLYFTGRELRDEGADNFHRTHIALRRARSQ